jgi:membrane fusion protein, macrolide-specific efflux system
MVRVGVVRKWVFPILRLVVFTAIAVALVKVAFFPDVTASDPAKPSGELVEPQVAVVRSTVENNVSLSGTVAADAAKPIRATFAGEVKQVFVKAGKHVKKGDRVLVLKGIITSPDGMTSTTKTVVVKATATGTVSDFPTLVGQTFAVGDVVGQIAPPTFHVSGSLAPEQLYRLSEQPTEADVSITGGPAPFTCTNLTISTPLAGQDGGDGSGGPTVTCAIPSDVTAFAGLAAQLTIAGGVAEDVLVVPMTAVEGTADVGNVYFVLPDGSTELRPVTLGLNDGFNVEIKDGLAEGDLILQYVPGAGAVDPNGGPIIDPGFGGGGVIDDGSCYVDDQGNEICK